MDGVMISIQPKWVEKILSGEKTIEVRKTRPKLDTPFKCYIYCTKGLSCAVFAENRTYDGVQMVVGEFTCDECYPIYENFGNVICRNDTMIEGSCLTFDEIKDYAGKARIVYGLHISELVIYDWPKEISDFRKLCESRFLCESCAMFRAYENECGNETLIMKKTPPSWCYVTE